VRELAHTGMQIAVFADQHRIGGSAALRAQAPDTCTETGVIRSCARAAGRFTVVAGRDATPLREHRQATLASALVAVTLTTLLGALGSLLLARRVLKPLEHLQRRVAEVPTEDPGGADLGPLAELQEVDALRASLSTALARLGTALQLAQRFARDAAHELRTPLTAILGELDLALERLPAEDSDELLRAQRVARRLEHLIERLLILARSEAHSSVAEPLDLGEVLEEAVDSLPPEARARVHVEAQPAPLHGDRELLRAMLSNALDNGLKYSSGPVRVLIAASAFDVVAKIEDEGPGLPAEEQERVFAPFYRTPASRARGVPGHGIGLALIAHVAKLHDGRARFVACSTGARLELVLPSTQEQVEHR
jgi:signal transduction histidine kinase